MVHGSIGLILDYGTDPSAWVAAADAGEVDMIYSIEGEFIDIVSSFDGWVQNEVVTMATVVVRPNQLAEVGGMQPYEDRRVRQAISMAVDNAVILELGYAGRGLWLKTTTSVPRTQNMCRLVRPSMIQQGTRPDGRGGMMDFEHELISIDGGYRKDTADRLPRNCAMQGSK